MSWKFKWERVDDDESFELIPRHYLRDGGTRRPTWLEFVAERVEKYGVVDALGSYGHLTTMRRYIEERAPGIYACWVAEKIKECEHSTGPLRGARCGAPQGLFPNFHYSLKKEPSRSMKETADRWAETKRGWRTEMIAEHGVYWCFDILYPKYREFELPDSYDVGFPYSSWERGRELLYKSRPDLAPKTGRYMHTPKWADRGLLKLAIMYIKSTGASVDHIIPIKGENVCGLHIASNLQPLPLLDNISKGNRFYDGDELTKGVVESEDFKVWVRSQVGRP